MYAIGIIFWRMHAFMGNVFVYIGMINASKVLSSTQKCTVDFLSKSMRAPKNCAKIVGDKKIITNAIIDKNTHLS